MCFANMESFIIAIDGYSSTGKSSFAKMIADKMGFVYVDSGAIYRLVALFALENGIIRSGEIDTDALRNSLPSIEVSYDINNSRSEICMNGVNVEQRIRMIDVADCVSAVSALPFVRDWVNDKLHSTTAGINVVMDGRDIGTTVFPNARLKIFMVADAAIRAERRMRQLRKSGVESSFEEVYRNLLERDYADSHRETSPLKQADDAIVLDNSNMTPEDQMSWIKNILKEKFNLSFNEA